MIDIEKEIQWIEEQAVETAGLGWKDRVKRLCERIRDEERAKIQKLLDSPFIGFLFSKDPPVEITLHFKVGNITTGPYVVAELIRMPSYFAAPVCNKFTSNEGDGK